MQGCNICYYSNNPGDATNLDDVQFAVVPQVGWTLIVTQVMRCRPHSRGIGLVTKIVLHEGHSRPTIFVQETPP